ncbi:MAG: electron transfer flavoprotein subunit alpha/FixB family protein [Alphaproteobacteria bacterium]|nr:electron transfer flavoprotein subunit alpha/FixB family protein [Alphaproteobacteria bacterium]
MGILVIAEHDNGAIKDSTLSTVGAALKLGDDLSILVAGKDCSGAAEAAAKIAGVSKVLKADSDALAHDLAENFAPLIVQIVKSGNYSHVLAPGTTFGKNIMPRAAAILDVQQITDIIGIEGPDTFQRPIYGGQAIATVKSTDSLKLITVRATAFDKAAATGGAAEIQSVDAQGDSGLSSFVSVQETKSERPELTSAKIVISGGRGVGSKENFALIEKLADKLGAAIGASRAAVDAGYVPNDYQVGQTGKAVAPELYIAIGISGAIQHLAGMKDSKVIVAINKDSEAPIFQIADYGLVGDLFDIVPELTEKL